MMKIFKFLVIFILLCSITACSNGNKIKIEEPIDKDAIDYAVQEDIKTTLICITEKDEVVVKVENTSDNFALINNVNAVFKDVNDEMQKVQSTQKYFVVNPNSYVYIPISSDYYTLLGYDFTFEVEVAERRSIEYGMFYKDYALNNVTMKDVVCEDHIAIELINNNKYSLGLLRIQATFFKNGKIVDTASYYGGLSNYLNENNQEVAYAGIDLVEYGETEKIDFDYYELSLLAASLNDEVEGKMDGKAVVIEKSEDSSDGKINAKLVNKSDSTVVVEDVYATFRDDKKNMLQMLRDVGPFTLEPNSSTDVSFESDEIFGMIPKQYDEIEFGYVIKVD